MTKNNIYDIIKSERIITVGGQSMLPKGGLITMNNYVTWSDLVQVGIFLTGFTSMIVGIIIAIIKRK